MFTHFPAIASELFSARARAYSQKLANEWGCIALDRKVIGLLGSKVLRGPFRGLELTKEAQKEHIGPYLLGTFERELQPSWDLLLERNFSQIIDVGAKFGYYAVGLARRFPEAEVLAFDTDPWARRALRQMNVANGTTVTILRYCDPEWLRKQLREDAFILSDCEGFEATLFGTSSIPALASATMLIEVHELVSPGVSEMLLQKYSGSHVITVIRELPELSEFPPELENLTVAERRAAVREVRGGSPAWMLLEPKG